MIDPLLNNTPLPVYPPPAPTAPKNQKKSPVPMRKKHPALSARILAVGLSTTAFIGMTTGYTLAQKQPATQPIVQDPSTATSAIETSGNDSSVQIAGIDTAATNSTQVVQVPVPSIATAATAGTAAPAYQPSQTQQQSSGSN